jgi:hypothetical protein
MAYIATKSLGRSEQRTADAAGDLVETILEPILPYILPPLLLVELVYGLLHHWSFDDFFVYTLVGGTVLVLGTLLLVFAFVVFLVVPIGLICVVLRPFLLLFRGCLRKLDKFSVDRGLSQPGLTKATREISRTPQDGSERFVGECGCTFIEKYPDVWIVPSTDCRTHSVKPR